MVVYVEYVVIDNMVINILILLLTKYLLKLNTKKIYITLSAMFGTLIAIISPLFNNTINLLIKIPLSVCMIYISFQPRRFKMFFAEILTFYISTFVMIGACLAVCEILGIKYIILSSVSYEYEFPIGFALGVCSIVFILTKNIFTYISKIHNNDKYLYKITLIEKEKTITTTAFLDTGNKLNSNNKPISIINYKIFQKLYPKILLMDILLKKQLPLKNSTYFEVKSIGTPQKILIFEIEKIVINKREIENPLLGLSFENFEKTTRCDAIISTNLIGE